MGHILRVLLRLTSTHQAYRYVLDKFDDGRAVDAAVAARDAAAASAAQLAAGTASPAGTYANLTALNTDNPDNSKIYITLDDGSWCYWNGSSFVTGGVYQTVSVAEKSIGTKETEYPMAEGVWSKNLFNKDTVTEGKYVSASTGNLGNGSPQTASDFIEVKGNTDYAISEPYPSEAVAFYNAAKVFISGIETIPTYTFKTPSLCKYLRVTTQYCNRYTANRGRNCNNSLCWTFSETNL